MSETEPIVPTSAVTALLESYNQESGEYRPMVHEDGDSIFLSLITTWDIITNGNQTTTDPANSSTSSQFFMVLSRLQDLYGKHKSKIGENEAIKEDAKESFPSFLLTSIHAYTPDEEDLLQIDELLSQKKLTLGVRECRFAKYQENKANGRQEKKIVAIEDSNSKALVATDNNEDIDWTKTFLMLTTTLL
ncbi:hypothetical protein Tco_1016491 [Tanacetum coccineum]|uniref:Uncharacterized protein n=1 Tax=Tanacetum coccineum TaxID=301880 RepID=A0ABQ5FNX1_9ASTR